MPTTDYEPTQQPSGELDSLLKQMQLTEGLEASKSGEGSMNQSQLSSLTEQLMNMKEALFKEMKQYEQVSMPSQVGQSPLGKTVMNHISPLGQQTSTLLPAFTPLWESPKVTLVGNEVEASLKLTDAQKQNLGPKYLQYAMGGLKFALENHNADVSKMNAETEYDKALKQTLVVAWAPLKNVSLNLEPSTLSHTIPMSQSSPSASKGVAQFNPWVHDSPPVDKSAKWEYNPKYPRILRVTVS